MPAYFRREISYWECILCDMVWTQLIINPMTAWQVYLPASHCFGSPLVRKVSNVNRLNVFDSNYSLRICRRSESSNGVCPPHFTQEQALFCFFILNTENVSCLYFSVGLSNFWPLPSLSKLNRVCTTTPGAIFGLPVNMTPGNPPSWPLINVSQPIKASTATHFQIIYVMNLESVGQNPPPLTLMSLTRSLSRENSSQNHFSSIRPVILTPMSICANRRNLDRPDTKSFKVLQLSLIHYHDIINPTCSTIRMIRSLEYT